MRYLRAYRGGYLRIFLALRQLAADGGLRARQVPGLRRADTDAPEADAAAAVGAGQRVLMRRGRDLATATTSAAFFPDFWHRPVKFIYARRAHSTSHTIQQSWWKQSRLPSR